MLQLQKTSWQIVVESSRYAESRRNCRTEKPQLGLFTVRPEERLLSSDPVVNGYQSKNV